MSDSTGFSARKEGEMDKNVLYRSIPKVDILLEKDEIKAVISEYGRDSYGYHKGGDRQAPPFDSRSRD